MYFILPQVPGTSSAKGAFPGCPRVSICVITELVSIVEPKVISLLKAALLKTVCPDNIGVEEP